MEKNSSFRKWRREYRLLLCIILCLSFYFLIYCIIVWRNYLLFRTLRAPSGLDGPVIKGTQHPVSTQPRAASHSPRAAVEVPFPSSFLNCLDFLSWSKIWAVTLLSPADRWATDGSHWWEPLLSQCCSVCPAQVLWDCGLVLRAQFTYPVAAPRSWLAFPCRAALLLLLPDIPNVSTQLQMLI